jgi:hypothetical protein
MAELSERFEDKYGVNAKAVAEEVLLDYPVKSVGMVKCLDDYFERKGLKTEVTREFLVHFIEALADSKFTLPSYAKIDFDPTPIFEIPKVVASVPKSKGLIYDFKGIVGVDDLRPNMKGVYVDEGGFVVGTDAHKLISVKTNELSHHEGKIIDVKRFIDSAGKRVEYIDEKYPDWKRILPTENLVVKDVDLVSLNNYLAGCETVTKYIKNYFFHINLTLGEVAITFNLPIIHSIVKFFLARGYERANFEYTAANRPMLIKSNGNEVWGLIMPMMSEVGSETGTKRKTLYEIQNEYSSKANEKPRARKVEVERKKEAPKGKYDLSQLSEDEQVQAKELMEAIETFQFLLDSMFEGEKMAVGGIVEAFSSPQLVDGMYGAISTFAKGGMVEAKQISMEFAQGGQMVTREQRINAYKQMLAEGGQTYAEAQENWNKEAGLPTKQDAMDFIKENPEVLLKRGGRPKKK